MAKLSNQQVEEIIAEFEAAKGARGTKHRLAVKYGLSDTHVGRLVNRKNKT